VIGATPEPNRRVRDLCRRIVPTALEVEASAASFLLWPVRMRCQPATQVLGNHDVGGLPIEAATWRRLTVASSEGGKPLRAV
jgi:hypothetical protein